MRDVDCANAIFCDGVERCEPGNVRADARGCMPASPLNPCTVGQVCDESAQRCLGNTIDADADGADSDGFGAGAAVAGCLGTAGKSLLGNDCDDSNPAVSPGALVCTPVVGPGNYNLCNTAGTFEGGKCSLQMTCHPQPNGTGVCF